MLVTGTVSGGWGWRALLSLAALAAVGVTAFGSVAGGATVASAGTAAAGPTVTCSPAPTGWSKGPVIIACTASSTIGLRDAPDASFNLEAVLPPGEVLADAATNAQMVCDIDGNCTTAGPVTGIKIATAGPDVACTPTTGDWSPTDVVVTCLSTDLGPGLAHLSQASMSFSTKVPAGQAKIVTLTAVKVCDTIGNCTTAGPFGPLKVDKSVPKAICGTAPQDWSGTNVSVTCHVTDTASGLANSSQSSVTLSTTVPAGQAQADASTGSVQVCSNVGNCATVGPVTGLKVDLSLPDVTCATPSGWSTGPVTVNCTATESGSGLADPGDAKFALVASVAPGTETSDASTGTKSICSAVANCTKAGPVTEIRIDDSAPEITCPPAPVAWQSGAVTIRCSAVEDGAGLSDPTQATFSLVAAVPAGGWSADVSTGTEKVCSSLGICTQAGPVGGAKIDTTKPVVSCSNPPAGRLTLNIFVHCTASDAASGLADPADASFELFTSVPTGQDQPEASTGDVKMCSLSGMCTTAGPIVADIDRAVPASGGWPKIEVPKMATVVIATKAPPGGAALDYPVPVAYDSLGEQLATVCSPGPSAPFQPGWTTVSCDATDGAGRQSVSNFPVVVKVDPTLAPSGPAVAGAEWRVVGVGYAPGSAVTASFDSTAVGGTKAGSTGTAAVDFKLPANAGNGEHEVALAGRDPQGNPLTVVLQVASVVRGYVAQGGIARPGPALADHLPRGAPVVPGSGAVLPPSPADEPVVAASSHVTVPGASATAPSATTTPPTTPPTTAAHGATSTTPTTAAHRATRTPPTTSTHRATSPTPTTSTHRATSPTPTTAAHGATRTPPTTSTDRATSTTPTTAAHGATTAPTTTAAHGATTAPTTTAVPAGTTTSATTAAPGATTIAPSATTSAPTTATPGATTAPPTTTASAHTTTTARSVKQTTTTRSRRKPPATSTTTAARRPGPTTPTTAESAVPTTVATPPVATSKAGHVGIWLLVALVCLLVLGAVGAVFWMRRRA